MLLTKHYLFTLFFSCGMQVLQAQVPDSAQGQTSNLFHYLSKDSFGVRIPVNRLLEHESILLDTFLKAQFKKGSNFIRLPNLQSKENLVQQLRSKVSLFESKQIIKAGKLSAEIAQSFVSDAVEIVPGMTSSTSRAFNYDIRFGVSLINIPFSTSLKGSERGYVFSPAPGNPDHFLKFNFDPKKYREALTDKILEKVNPDMITAAITDKINSIRLNYEKSLEREIATIRFNLQKESGVQLSLPDNISDLSINDFTGLQSKMLPAAELEQIRQAETRLQNLLNTEGLVSHEKDSIYLKATQNIKKLEAIEKIYTKIRASKQKLEGNKELSELKAQLPFTPGSFKTYLSKPDNLESVIRQHANLSTLQTIFTGVSKLDVGRNPLNESISTIKDVMNTGINTEIKGQKLAIGGIVGRNNTINPWLNAGLMSPVTNEYNRLMGLKLGSGKNAGFSQAVSINFFDFNDQLNALNRLSNIQAAALPLPAHKDAVLSIHTEVPLATGQHLSVNLSKSIGTFSNIYSRDSSYLKANTLNSLLGNGGTSNYAAEIEYEGTLLNTGVVARIKKAGLGYNNPGNSLLHRGETGIGLNLSRKIYKNRVTIRYFGEAKVQNFDPAKNYAFATFNNRWQINGKLNRFTRIGLTYQRSDYRSSLYNQQVTYGGSSRLQMDGGYRLTLGKRRFINNFTVSSQQFHLPAIDGSSYNNNSLMLTHISTVMLGKNFASVAILSNLSGSSDYYFNTSFLNLETNYAYGWNSLKLSSSVGYYSNTGWNRQVGIKQQLSVMLGSKLSVDMEIGVKKAIYVERPELANPIYTNSYLRYNF